MKKIGALFVTLIFVLGLTVSPVLAGGGKQHGDVGKGVVDQGDAGNPDASWGDDAQGNQAD